MSTSGYNHAPNPSGWEQSWRGLLEHPPIAYNQSADDICRQTGTAIEAVLKGRGTTPGIDTMDVPTTLKANYLAHNTNNPDAVNLIADRMKSLYRNTETAGFSRRSWYHTSAGSDKRLNNH